MKGHKGFLGVIVFLSLFSLLPVARGEVLQEIFTEDFENGLGDWDVTNGVWQAGTPTAGPSTCHGGQKCAGTNLVGNYPTDTDSRLISPFLGQEITLPEVTGNQELRLRFWQWFAYWTNDRAVVQISEFDEANGTWSEWLELGGEISVQGSESLSSGWSRTDLSLTAYTGKTIRIGFYHTADTPNDWLGWYIDDIQVLKLIPEFTGDFEDGWVDWSASQGVWQIGAPGAGPGTCHAGASCAGTVLNGNYPTYTDSRLVSAPIDVPALNSLDQEIRLRYWQWFAYWTNDRAVVQISEFDEANGTWSEWLELGGEISVQGSESLSSGWSRTDLSLTAYTGKTIRIGFYHTADTPNDWLGWYIDDVEVLKLIPEFTGDFEDGWVDWSASQGVWQIGAPGAGPGTCHAGASCAGTKLNGNYDTYTDSRLVSAPIDVPALDSLDQEIRLRYWQWFAYWTNDRAVVQISEFDEANGTWSEWLELGGEISVQGSESLSSGWSRTDLSLTAYTGKTIRIGFYHTADTPNDWLGWYIDDIQVLKLIPEFTGDFEDGWVDWSASQGVWQIGAPGAGPGTCHAGASCAGTKLNGNYDTYTDSRLVSAPIRLPEDPGPELNVLRFWHWYSYSTNDSGKVMIRSFDEGAGQWLDWDDDVPGGGPFTGVSGGWSRKTVSLSQYAGKIIEIAFSHSADTPNDSTGWYIDNVRVPGVYLSPCEGDFDNDGDVDGSDLTKYSNFFGRVNCSVEFDFCSGDFDNDGDVDGSDLGVFSGDFGNTPDQCFLTP